LIGHLKNKKEDRFKLAKDSSSNNNEVSIKKKTKKVKPFKTPQEIKCKFYNNVV
jgi:hypothetical protein